MEVFLEILLNKSYFQDDELTHLYTLIVRADNTYEVRIDNVKEQSGKLEEDWDFLEPKQVIITVLARESSINFLTLLKVSKPIKLSWFFEQF